VSFALTLFSSGRLHYTEDKIDRGGQVNEKETMEDGLHGIDSVVLRGVALRLFGKKD
jgi:hypothetical protein